VSAEGRRLPRWLLQVELPHVGVLQTAANRRLDFVWQQELLDKLDIICKVGRWWGPRLTPGQAGVRRIRLAAGSQMIGCEGCAVTGRRSQVPLMRSPSRSATTAGAAGRLAAAAALPSTAEEDAAAVG
jgi:hypothetical protein